jgi:hypothetical protein
MNLELSAVSLNGIKKAPPEQEVGDIGGSVEPNLRTIPPNNLPPLLARNEAAAYLKSLGLDVAPRTLAKLACVGGGPAFRHFGRKVPQMDQPCTFRLGLATQTDMEHYRTISPVLGSSPAFEAA